MKVKEFCNAIASSTNQIVKVYIVDGEIGDRQQIGKIGFWACDLDLVALYQSTYKADFVFSQSISDAEILEIYSITADNFVIAIDVTRGYEQKEGRVEIRVEH